MVSCSIEMQCSQHGLERFSVKIIRRLNIASNEIMPKSRMRPRAGEISCLYVGRNVSYEQAQTYIVNYFREKGVGEIVRVKMLI